MLQISHEIHGKNPECLPTILTCLRGYSQDPIVDWELKAKANHWELTAGWLPIDELQAALKAAKNPSYFVTDDIDSMPLPVPVKAVETKAVPVEAVAARKKTPQREDEASPGLGKDQRFKTLEEAADKLRKNPAWLRAHSNGSRQPTIPRIKMGKGYVFDDKDLDELLASCRETAIPRGKRKSEK